MSLLGTLVGWVLHGAHARLQVRIIITVHGLLPMYGLVMSVSVVTSAEGVDVTITGIDVAMAFRRQLHLPYTDVESAAVLPVRELKKNLGWRVGGSYFPGRFAAGNFLSRGDLKGRQFWCVYRDTEVLVIDLAQGPFRRVVLQTPNRIALAGEINGAVARLKGR